MNAIERLRDLSEQAQWKCSEDPSCPDCAADTEAVAAVDALYQAAKAPTREYECAHGHRWVMKDGTAKTCPGCGTITFMLVLPRADDPVAAAVRRVDGEA